MNLSTNRLIAASGMCAAAAGAVFVGVQINHPPIDVETVVHGDLVLRQTAKAIMAVLALVGVGGLFARHRRSFGALGLCGALLLSVGFLAMFAVECIVGYVLPIVGRTSPGYVQDFIDAALGKSAAGDLGHMNSLFTIMGVGYAVGGLMFGIALFRGRVVSRWASALLAYGTVSALSLAVLPDSFNRPFAVPTGVALIGLGISLWRDQWHHHDAIDTSVARQLAAR